MIFLLQYDRNNGKLINITPYPDSERVAAQDERLSVELSLLQKGISHEVVLLEAENIDALKQTHSRYFLNPQEIAST